MTHAKTLRTIALGLVACSWSNLALAQRYGGYNGPGSTPQGDMARGMGRLYDGLGNYERNSAIARSIDVDSQIKLNEYIYQSLQQEIKSDIEKLTKTRDRNLKNYREIRKAIRDNPTDYDLRQGSALNVMLEELADPRIHPSSFRDSKINLDPAVIRSIPFRYNQLGGVISMRQMMVLDKNWPLAMKSDAFATTRKAYLKAVETVLEQNLDGKLKPESVKAVKAAVEDLKKQVETTIPLSDRTLFNESINFVRRLGETARLLETPLVEDVLTDIERYSGTTVGELIEFMKRYHLRFSPESAPGEYDVYRNLYPLLRQQREALDIKEK